MCKPTKDGYEMDDGVIVPYDASINAIKPEYIETLNVATSTAWDSWLLHRESKEFRQQVSDMEKKILTKIETTQNIHREICPLNINGIDALIESKVSSMAENGLRQRLIKIVNETMKGTTVKVYNGFKGVLRDLILIATSLGAFYVIKGFFSG
jgi:hypothetical protein